MANDRSRSILLAAVLAAVVALVLWLAQGVDRPARVAIASEEPTPAAPSTVLPALESPTRARAAAAAVAFEAAPALAHSDASASDLAQRPSGELDVLVRDEDRHVVPEVELELVSEPPPHRDGYPVKDERDVRRGARTDAAGRARFDGIPAGAYRFVASAPDGRRVRRSIGVYPGREPLEVTLPVRAEPWELCVRVVDAGSLPIAGARVQVTGYSIGVGLVGMGGCAPLEATSDAEGLARFEGQELDSAVVLATAQDGRVGRASVSPGSRPPDSRAGPIQIVVDAPCRLEGSLEGLPADALTSARVRAHALTDSFPHNATVGPSVETRVEDGRYRFAALAPGKWTLEVVDPEGARLVLPLLKQGDFLPNSIDPVEAELFPGKTTFQDLVVTRGARLEGLVRRADGSPVIAAEVRVTFTPRTSSFADGAAILGVNPWRYDSERPGKHPLTHPSTRTGPDGRYRLDGLQPGRQRVEVLAAGLSYDRREEVNLADGETTELEHVLTDAGAIEGIEPSGYLAVRRAGEVQPRMIASVARDGRFSFPGLEPGAWSLESVHTSLAPVPLATVEVFAGRTTWIDLRDVRRPVRIAGRVIGTQGPVAGAAVRLPPQWKRTDAEGRFELMRSYPIRTGRSLFNLRLQVEHAGIVSGFYLAPRQESGWEGDLLLGSETLTVRTLGAEGAAAPAKLTLEMQVEPDPDVELCIESVATEGDCADESTFTGLAPGPYTVWATFENGAVLQAVAEVPAAAPIVVRCPQTVDLTVLLRNADGSVPSPAYVYVWTWMSAKEPPAELEAFAEGSGNWRYGDTDAEGRVHLRGVAAGELWIQGWREWTPKTPEARADRRCHVSAGDAPELELVLDETPR